MNEKNFVGLTANSEYLSCGSETNEVFVYHKVIQTCVQYAVVSFMIFSLVRFPFTLQAISKPVARYKFNTSEFNNADDDRGSYFISSVCWKTDSPVIMAANSQGNVKILSLAA